MTGMTHRVLVLVGHPNLADSRINDALASAASEVPAVTVRNLETVLEQHQGHFDTATEQTVIDQYDVVVFQFPWYWYSAPAIVKQYLDEILTGDWAYMQRYALEGKSILFAISTGGSADAYQADGHNKFTMNELLAPYIATANKIKMVWHEPFIVHGARAISAEVIDQACAEYQQLLTDLAND